MQTIPNVMVNECLPWWTSSSELLLLQSSTKPSEIVFKRRFNIVCLTNFKSFQLESFNLKLKSRTGTYLSFAELQWIGQLFALLTDDILVLFERLLQLQQLTWIECGANTFRLPGHAHQKRKRTHVRVACVGEERRMRLVCGWGCGFNKITLWDRILLK